jgi:hypothetical protein
VTKNGFSKNAETNNGNSKRSKNVKSRFKSKYILCNQALMLSLSHQLFFFMKSEKTNWTQCPVQNMFLEIELEDFGHFMQKNQSGGA